MTQWIVEINGFLMSKWLVILLIGAGLFFTIRVRGFQLRLFKDIRKLFSEDSAIDRGKGEISSFQSFCIGAATRIGTGNMAGVAMALTIGGPGAIIWMWLVAILGGATSFVESTLAQIYKVRDGQGFKGGPAYYMERALGKRWLGILFGVFVAITFGLIFNSVQSNTIALAFDQSFSVSPVVSSVILTVATALVIFGGTQRIAKLSATIVPVMAVVYLLVSIVVLVLNVTEIPAVLMTMFKQAFGIEQVVGGGIGVAVMQGVMRGLFSNEAGMGSAPHAAATATVSHPAKQGIIQTLGVYVDTLLICTSTAVIILMADAFGQTDATGIELLQLALTEHLGGWAGQFVAICILLFAFTTIIGSYFYGETNITNINNRKEVLTAYRVVVLGMVAYGALAPLATVWTLAELFMAIIASINLVSILFISPIAIKALKDYQEQRKKGLYLNFIKILFLV
ncbi:alanine/glycine:cation symporter family protein [Mangrovibacillus cuniculi]|uniref:alanine/glycine:cation symporter family protein n=1 Tax=Mangrovibacillus cuniculi TaxID=2593652 RepID=UPI0030846202